MIKLKNIGIGLFCFAGFLFSAAVSADTLELKNGTMLKGTFKSGTDTTITFDANGVEGVYQKADVVELKMGDSGATGKSEAKTEKAEEKAETKTAYSGKVEVPAGTPILIKVSEEVGTHNKSSGDRFKAMLEGNLSVDGTVVAPAGSVVYGKVVHAKKGRIAQKAELELTLTSVNINGDIVPLYTSGIAGDGPNSGAGKKIVKGALIGALADGSRGSKDGAKIGAGIAILGGGKDAGVRAGTLLEFRLEQAFSH